MNVSAKKIDQIKKEFGDAFYLLDTEQFKKNFLELKEAFSKIYPHFNIAYSYKTNYTPWLCKIINELGGYAEVVSDMEAEIAQRIGVAHKNVIWNGPIKDPIKLEKFLISGGTANMDSKEELILVKEIVIRNPDVVFNLGIRCNYEVGDGVLSRFGFDTDSEDFMEAVKFTSSTHNVKFNNIQCHFAKRQVEYWHARAKGMIELIERLGVVPERIDIGGGLFGKMEDSLKAQFSSKVPNYQAYAEAAATVFAEYFKDKDEKPELLIEPGSAIVGDCMKFVGTVKSIKNIRGKYIATILGSQKNINMGGVNPPIEVISMGGQQKEYNNMDMVGFTCIEDDVLYHNFTGKLANGDAIVISNCGSYSLVMKPPFILPNFPVLNICEEEVQVVKRGETFDDIFHTFNF